MSIHELLAADKNISPAFVSAFDRLTHTQQAPRRSPFDVLIAHIEAARADAASLVGQMSNASEVHAMLDEALCFAREHCYAVDTSAEDAHYMRDEEFYMEQARGF